MKLVQAVRARPKSKILRVQSDFTTMLLGFRSWGGEKLNDSEEEKKKHINISVETRATERLQSYSGVNDSRRESRQTP